MRFTAVLAGLLACTVIFLTNSPEVSAQSNNNTDKLTSTDVLTLLDENSLADELAPKDDDKPEEKAVKYVVSEGDTLAGIANSYKTEWTRIFNKNENITDPNILNPGITIIIPDEEESLPTRTEEMQVEAPTPVETPASDQPYQVNTLSRG